MEFVFFIFNDLRDISDVRVIFTGGIILVLFSFVRVVRDGYEGSVRGVRESFWFLGYFGTGFFRFLFKVRFLCCSEGFASYLRLCGGLLSGLGGWILV